MKYDYMKLKGKIVEKFGNQGNFAKKLEISDRTLSLKLNNRKFWSQEQIRSAANLLDIPAEEIHLYFFDLKVQSN